MRHSTRRDNLGACWVAEEGNREATGYAKSQKWHKGSEYMDDVIDLHGAAHEGGTKE